MKGSAPLQAMNTFSRVWMERSLDDSAIRRIMIPEIFLGADSWLRLLIKIKSRLVVHRAIIQKRWTSIYRHVYSPSSWMHFVGIHQENLSLFEPIWAQWPLLFSPLSFTGRAREQVRTFSGEGCDINWALRKHQMLFKDQLYRSPSLAKLVAWTEWLVGSQIWRQIFSNKLLGLSDNAKLTLTESSVDLVISKGETRLDGGNKRSRGLCHMFDWNSFCILWLSIDGQTRCESNILDPSETYSVLIQQNNWSFLALFLALVYEKWKRYVHMVAELLI